MAKKVWIPVQSRGMAAEIKKRTCHITIILDEKVPGKKKAKGKPDKDKSKAPKVTRVKTKEDISKLAKAEEKESGQEEQPDKKTGYFQGKKHDGPEGSDKSGKKFRGFVDKIFRRKSEG